MAALEDRYEAILNNVAIVPVNNSKIHNIFRALRNIFSLKTEKNLDNQGICKYLVFNKFLYYNLQQGEIMINFNIEELLKREGKTKYWLCKNMNITNRNLNRIINR